jgi:uncharacterized protein (TIRG00374 family)
MRSRAARIALFSGTLLISTFFAYLALRNSHYDETWRALRTVDYWWLVPATVTFLLSIPIRAIRWRVLFEPRRRPPLGATTKATLLGLFFNSILPARAGEAARVVALKQYAGVSLAESTTTIVVERVFDVLSLLLLLFVTTPWLPHVSWLRSAAVFGIALLVVLAGAIAAVVIFGERPVRFLVRPITWLPGFHETDVDQVAASVNHGLAPLRRPGQGLLGFGWTVASWLVIGLSVWFLMLGFDLHLSFLAALLATVAVGLAFIVPAAPAALGVFEAAAIAATRAYGVPQSQALAYALVLHALNFFPYILGGLVLLAVLPRRNWMKRAEVT